MKNQTPDQVEIGVSVSIGGSFALKRDILLRALRSQRDDLRTAIGRLGGELPALSADESAASIT